MTPETLARLQVTPTANPITVQKEGMQGSSTEPGARNASVPLLELQGWGGSGEQPVKTSLASMQPLAAGKLRFEALLNIPCPLTAHITRPRCSPTSQRPLSSFSPSKSLG